MKLIDHSATRRGNAEMKMTARWADNMRRPAQVRISWGPLESPTAEPQPLIDGDVKQCTDILFSIADLAWGLGWRPKGLPGTVAAFIQQYKIPQE